MHRYVAKFIFAVCCLRAENTGREIDLAVASCKQPMRIGLGFAGLHMRSLLKLFLAGCSISKSS
jgi:hypothetical protein